MPKALKENRFTLARSTNKKEDWQSDYNGKVHIVCDNCGHSNHAYLNGYINEGQSGKYFSGPIKPFTPDEFPQEKGEVKSADPDDDIPF